MAEQEMITQVEGWRLSFASATIPRVFFAMAYQASSLPSTEEQEEADRVIQLMADLIDAEPSLSFRGAGREYYATVPIVPTEEVTNG